MMSPTRSGSELMATRVSVPPTRFDRTVPFLMADDRHTIAEIVAECAGLALDTAASLPHSGRRFLSEAKRQDYSIRRARMFQWWDEFYEWMAYAPREIATLPAERMRGAIVRHQETPAMCLVSGIQHENRWNARADDFERSYLNEKTSTRIDGLIHGWSGQLEATRLGLDVAHAARSRRTISVPR